MNKLIKTVCWLFVTVLLLVSCMKSDDNKVTLYSDTAITYFSLGTLNQYLHTKSSQGLDSIYKRTFDGSDYIFSIDQANHRIFNVDSLPYGTDVKHVITYISTMNNATPFLKSLEEEGTLIFYSSSDSIDYSTPREFEVYASDGVTYDTYKVELNVHKEKGDQFIWMLHQDSPELEELDLMKAVMLDDQLFVYGTKEGKTLGYMTTDGDSWKPLEELNDENAYRNLLVFENHLYTIVNGSLMQSADGMSWKEMNSTLDITQLVAASYDQLFGLTSDGTMMLSDDYGETWKEDLVDSDKSWLPTAGTAYVCYPAQMTYYADNILLAGISTGISNIASVWRKIVEYDLQGDEKWVYMSRSDNNLYALPLMENLVMMAYDDGILAWGVKDDAYTQIYQSRDNGIIWKKNSSYQLPVAFVESGTVPFGAATDGKEIWLVGSNGQVWQGHLNRVAWDKSE